MLLCLQWQRRQRELLSDSDYVHRYPPEMPTPINRETGIDQFNLNYECLESRFLLSRSMFSFLAYAFMWLFL